MSCGKHKCTVMCCNAQNHECNRICNGLLDCRQHRCDRACHVGRCNMCYAVSKYSLFSRNYKKINNIFSWFNLFILTVNF